MEHDEAVRQQATEKYLLDELSPEQREQFDELMKRPFHKPLFNTNAPLVNPASTNGTSTNAL